MRRRFRLAALGCLLWFGCMGIQPAVAAPLPQTHGAMLDSVARLVTGDLLHDAKLPDGRTIRIATPLPGDTSGFIAQRLVEQLRARGSVVRLVPPWTATDVGGGNPRDDAKLDSTDLVLDLNIGNAGIAYVRTLRKFPVGIRGYERIASARVGATLLDSGTRDVVWAKTASAQLGDIVLKRDLAYVGSGSGGLSPALPRGGGGRLLEPLIVVGVVTGLVVLFYSNRN